MSRNILEVENLTKRFIVKGNSIEAVKNVYLNIGENEVVGLVGESGCGKSTLARLITRLEDSDEGKIVFCGTDITNYKGIKLREKCKNMKMIFQEPRSSFDPRFTLGASIRETLLTSKKMTKSESKIESVNLLKQVGLEECYDKMKPTAVSGGECQRAAIARALAGNPKLLICDEATSSLDVSVQAQILELLRKIQKEDGMSVLFISHDLALVSSFCERTYVMHKGKIVENGFTSQIIKNPKHEYSKRLIDSVLPIN